MALKIKTYNRKWYKNNKEIAFCRKLAYWVTIADWSEDEINCTVIWTVAFFAVSSVEKNPNTACYRMSAMYRIHLDICTLAILTFHSIAVIEHRDITQIKLTPYWLHWAKWIPQILHA